MVEHPVPQHIADFKFKLFGNLTAKQFFTLIVPLSFAVLIFFSTLPTIIRLPLTLTVGAFAFTIALVPINGMSFDKWAVAFFKAVTSPTQRVWVKEKIIPEFLKVITKPAKIEAEIPQELSSQKKEKLMAYLKTLPTENSSPLDLREEVALQDIEYASQSLPQTIAAPRQTIKSIPPIIWSMPLSQTYSPFSKISNSPRQQEKTTPKMAEVTKEAGKQIHVELPRTQTITFKKSVSQTAVERPLAKVMPHAKPYIVQGVEKRINRTLKPTQQYIELVETPILNLASDTNYSTENIISIRTPDNKIKLFHGIGETRARKLHFAPPENFDLSKLPVRGEKRFEISEDLKSQLHIADFTPPVELPQQQAQEPIPTPIVKETIGNFQSRMVPRTTQSAIFSQGQQVITQPQPQNPIPSNGGQTAQRQFSVTDLKKQTSSNKPLISAEIIPLTQTPNVISGLVSDSLGSPIPGAVLVIRDTHGIPIRALKTNKLGQFLSATPLTKGDYDIEIESELVKFEPVKIHIKDKVVQPMAIVGEKS